MSLTTPFSDVAAMKALSQNGYDINNKNTYFQALDWASNEGHLPIVRLLLERSTDVNAQNEDGETKLFYACKNGCKDIVGRLLDQGADIKTRGGKYKGLLIDYALKHEAILELLLDRGAEIDSASKASPLTKAVMLNYVAAVKLLLDKGARIEGPDYSATPLQVASMKGHIEIARLLLDAGADINNVKGYLGRTPLMWAATNGHVAVIQLLLDRGADSKIKFKIGSALDLAKSEGHSEAVKVLKAARTGLIDL